MELTVNLDDTLSVPLYRQLYEALRVTILAGRLPRGQRLPSSRSLARQLSVSRNTVNQAYGELEAEGYLWGRHGSGTFVSQELPDDRPHGATFLVGTLPTGARRELALRTRINGANTEDTAAPVTLPPAGLPYDFHPGQGAWDAFPREVWRRLLARQWRTGWHEAMDYGDPAGYRPLREQVAAYLARSRAVRCTPEQVVIVNGTQQALDLLARVLLEPGDRVAVENPGYRAARQVFASYRADLLPVSVDDEGMMVDRLRDSGARIVLVAPSHQFPSGSVLSLRRRLSLLAWGTERRRPGGGGRLRQRVPVRGAAAGVSSRVGRCRVCRLPGEFLQGAFPSPARGLCGVASRADRAVSGRKGPDGSPDAHPRAAGPGGLPR